MLHPDRFSRASVEVRKLSLDRMSLVNRAYQTLMDPDSLARHLLLLEGFDLAQNLPDENAKAAKVPVHLAEKYFEAQSSQVACAEFEQELLSVMKEKEAEILTLEKKHDESISDQNRRECLKNLGALLQEKNYLLSLQKAVRTQTV